MDLPVIEKEALQLPDVERALLADRLLLSLQADSDTLTKLWVAESESRLEAYQRGEIEAVDGEEVIASLRQKYRK